MLFLSPIIASMRPWQWMKNGLLFAGLIFSGNLTSSWHTGTALSAFALFCIGSGCIYILNDITDRKKDPEHPLKKSRPIASGELPLNIAIGVLILLSFSSIIVSALLFNSAFNFVFLSYLILMVLYVFILKHLVIIDLLTVAIGFVLRALAGAVVINVAISPWLIICTFLAALFLLMGKRRHELLVLGEQSHKHRFILKEYSQHFIDQMMSAVSSATIITYCLYTFSEPIISRTKLMPLTIPLVLYGIFRYLYLTHQKNLGGSPEVLLLKDRPSAINIFLWILSCCLCVYL